MIIVLIHVSHAKACEEPFWTTLLLIFINEPRKWLKPHSDFSATSKKARANLVQAFEEATNMKAHLYPGLTQKGIKSKPVGNCMQKWLPKTLLLQGHVFALPPPTLAHSGAASTGALSNLVADQQQILTGWSQRRLQRPIFSRLSSCRSSSHLAMMPEGGRISSPGRPGFVSWIAVEMGWQFLDLKILYLHRFFSHIFSRDHRVVDLALEI